MVQSIVTYCDDCALEGTEAPAETWEITLTAPGLKAVAYGVDVCSVHRKPYADLLAHLAEVGHKAGRRPMPGLAVRQTGRQTPASGPVTAEQDPDGYPCPACDYVGRTAAGLATHARVNHDRSLAELRGEAPYPCPVTDCDRSAARPQGLSAHLRASHGYSTDDARAAVHSVEPVSA
jgi:hypothetical protein